MNNENILIIGGLGFIGSNLIENLLAENKRNKIIVFDFYGSINQFNEEIEIIYGDFNDVKSLEPIFQKYKIHKVIHLVSATVPFTSNLNIVYDIQANLIPTINLLHLMVNYKVPNLIFFSSGGSIYGVTENKSVNENHPTNPISSYGMIKLTIEKYIHFFNKQYGLNYLILRVSNPYGSYQTSNKQGIINVFMRKIIRGEKIEVRGDGSAVRDYIFVKDLTKIVIQLLNLNINNTIINIGSGAGKSINEILSVFKKITNKDLNVRYTKAPLSDIPYNVLDVSKLKSIINLNCISLESGISEMHKLIIKNN